MLGKDLQAFFDSELDFGRCKGWQVKDVFSSNRQYFDQILYKNQKFRHEYADAFGKWQAAKEMEENKISANDFLRLRIQAAIDIMGHKDTEKLFKSVLKTCNLAAPETLTFEETLPGEKFAADKANADAMEILARFWQRLALPIVREE